MTVKELKIHLEKLEKEGKGDMEIDVLIETPRDLEYQCQYQYPMNGLAVSTRQNKVIIMHEEW